MNGIKIFVVDDNLLSRKMLTKMLDGQEGIEVCGEAASGQGGILMLEDLAPDIVILEATVSGGMNAADIIREMKKILPEVRIVISTDAFSIDNIISIVNLGAEDFISKPFKQPVIMRVITDVILKIKAQSA